jgi:Collagen triple helix repeat (20 copies)
VLAGLRNRLTYSNVIATLALFIALGGTSIAAITLKRGSVKGKHIARNAITSPKVRNASLLSEDFAPGQLPRGEQGERGERGEKGDQGEAGHDGAPGQDGAPGTARAYGATTGTCTGTPTEFCALNSNKDVAYVAHVGTGIYCVGVNGITPATGVALVSLRFTPGRAVWEQNLNCVSSEFEIQTFDSSSLSNRAFVIAIP